jgi:hypothetical protein
VVQLYGASQAKKNEDCFVLSDHLHSFESYSWLNEQLGLKKHPHHPVCVMNAGYMSGWAGESLDHTDLVAAEVMCRARGMLARKQKAMTTMTNANPSFASFIFFFFFKLLLRR